MIFQNRHIGSQVTVDLDVFFFYFVRTEEETPEDERQGITIRSVKDRLRRLRERLSPMTIRAQYRRSSKDHVHVRLTFDAELSVLDGMMIRAWMLDDQTRLELDLARYLITDDLHEMNRCFDEKAELGGIKRAGPWISLELGKDNFPHEARKDWDEYLLRLNKAKTILAGHHIDPEEVSRNNKEGKQSELGFI